MPDSIPRITLEQWCVLQAVVDHGGFVQASEALNKSQSSVSYALGKLQNQLPIAILQQQGRRTELTEAGQTLLRRARALIEEARSLERLAASLAQGWESEIRLAVEGVFPSDRLLEVLDRFSRDCRQTRIQILETVLSGTDEALFSGQADLAISGRVPPGFLGTALMTVEFIAVAHPDHPLHRLNRPLSQRDLKAHRQIVIRDTGSRRSQDAGWLDAEQRWTVSHLQTSIRALRRGLGFAWIPRQHIEDDLIAGRLKPLPLSEGATSRHDVYLIFADRDNAGPATRELARLLQAVCDCE